MTEIAYSSGAKGLLVHFTGRSGNYQGIDDVVSAMSPQDRLESILERGMIWSSRPYLLSGSWSVVCFSEATEDFLQYVLGRVGYAPWGVVFKRDVVYERGGGPAMHYRRDEWTQDLLRELPGDVKSRLVRFTPGESDWIWEREWRIAFKPDEYGFAFRPDDVAALIVGAPDWEPVSYEFDAFGAWQHSPCRPDWLPDCQRWWWNPNQGRLEALW